MNGPYYVTTDSRRRAAYGAPCDVKDFSKVTIDGRSLTCNSIVVGAYQAFEQIRAHHGYRLTGNDTGFYSCRHMQHNPRLPMSFHSWAVPLDINWLENPAGNKLVTDIPKPMRDDILDLKTNSGAWVFRWGADWDRDGQWTDHSYVDAMHWEPIAHPLDLETGIAGFTFRPPDTEALMSLLGFNIGPLGEDSVGGAVGDPTGDRAETLQLGLLRRGEALPLYGADRWAGDETRKALASFQAKRSISGENGVVGPKTYDAWHAPAAAVDVGDLKDRVTVLESHDHSIKLTGKTGPPR